MLLRRWLLPSLALGLAFAGLSGCGSNRAAVEPVLESITPTRAAPGTTLEGRGLFTPATRLAACETPLDAPRFATDDGAVVSAADATAARYPRLLGEVPALEPGSVCDVQLVVDGVAGPAQEGVTVTILAPPSAAPGAPTDLVATPRDGAAEIAFTPAGDGVTNHAYSLDDGATWTDLAPPDPTPPVVVPDLPNGVPATIRLRARNAAGVGPASAPVTVTPVGPPGAPSDLATSPGDGFLTVDFTPPSPTGVSITNYAWSADDGATWTPLAPPDAAPPVTVSGLDVGRAYALRLRAVTPAGPGAASAPVAGTPRTVPAAPTAFVAWPEVADAAAGLPARTVLRFDPPDDGGAPVVRYEARRRAVSGSDWTAWTVVEGLGASPTGPRGRRVAYAGALPDWNDHVVELRAVNAAGPGPAATYAPVTRAMVLRGTISSGDVNPNTDQVFALPVSPTSVSVAWPDGISEASKKPGPNGPLIGVADAGPPSAPVPYELRIEGPLDAYGSGVAWSGAQTVTEVVSWGATGATSFDGVMQGASNLTRVPTWLPSTVTDLSKAFQDATSFDADLSGWDTSGVTNLTSTFAGATSFTAGVGAWDVANVSSLDSTFAGAVAFDEDLGDWDVAQVEDFTNTFRNALAFDGDVRTWETGSATSLYGTFRGAQAFDGAIGGWDVSSVQDMSYAFENATSFDRDLGGWDVRTVAKMNLAFEASGLSQANYDATLVGWADAVRGEGAPIRVVDARPFSPADAAVPRIYRGDLSASDTTVSASSVVVLESPHGIPFGALRATEDEDRFWVRLVTADASFTDVYLNVAQTDAFAADAARELALPVGLEVAQSLAGALEGSVVPLPVQGVELGPPGFPGGGQTVDAMRPSTPEAQAACDALVDGLGWTIAGVSTSDVVCRPPPG